MERLLARGRLLAICGGGYGQLRTDLWSHRVFLSSVCPVVGLCPWPYVYLRGEGASTSLSAGEDQRHHGTAHGAAPGGH